MEEKKVNKYVSFETVLGYCGVLAQETYRDTYAVRPSLESGLQEPHIHRVLPDNFFFGYYEKQVRGKKIYVADPEKAFLDLLYYQTKAREKIDLEQFDLSMLSPSKLEEYAKRMEFNYKEIIREYLKNNPKPSIFGYKIPDELAA